MKPRELIALIFLITFVISARAYFLRLPGKRGSVLKKKSSSRLNSAGKTGNLKGKYYSKEGAKLINHVCVNMFTYSQGAAGYKLNWKIRLNSNKFIRITHSRLHYVFPRPSVIRSARFTNFKLLLSNHATHELLRETKNSSRCRGIEIADSK